MSFTLSIKNQPSGSYRWYASYASEEVYSGWLTMSQYWDCPYGAYGTTDLHIFVVDSSYNVIHNQENLGPIYDGRSYVYDCATRTLSEVVPSAEFSNFLIRSYNVP